MRTTELSWLMIVALQVAGLTSLNMVAAQAPTCCEPPLSDRRTTAVHLDPLTNVAPQMDAAQARKIRLPDVHIGSVVHYAANSRPVHRNAGLPAGNISVPHTEIDGTIGGTIGFELLLPDQWNGRFVMGGGGGFVGRVSNYASPAVNRGYATAGTDTGHQWPTGTTAGWAMDNVEAQVNFGHVAVHRTAQVAKGLIRAYYGQDPVYSYFSGCSTGGGQALIEAQRYPDDFDGIISAAPVVNHVALAAARLYNAQRFFPDPNRLGEPLVTQQLLDDLHAEVVRQCDEQDGVKDGLLDDPRLCDFELADFAPLNAQQRDALQALYDGPRNQHGQIYPGMPLGSEHRWYFWKSGSMPAVLRRDKAPNSGFALGIEFCKYFVFNDPDWDYSRYDFDNWQHDTRLVDTYTRGDNPDLSEFRKAGGKLILWHGWSDGPLTPLASIQYFEEVERLDPQVRDYFRLYLLPGVTHCWGGSGPDRVDWLDAIVQWVEQDQAPFRLVATKWERDELTMSRAVYPYPLRAVYRGSGSTAQAENFLLPD